MFGTCFRSHQTRFIAHLSPRRPMSVPPYGCINFPKQDKHRFGRDVPHPSFPAARTPPGLCKSAKSAPTISCPVHSARYLSTVERASEVSGRNDVPIREPSFPPTVLVFYRGIENRCGLLHLTNGDIRLPRGARQPPILKASQANVALGIEQRSIHACFALFCKP